METSLNQKRKGIYSEKSFCGRWLLFLSSLQVQLFYVSRNLNRLVSEALIKGFNSNAISDVYELKFEKLRINIFAGNIRVFNVVLQPRQKPLHDYPYINSSFRLETRKILLEDVQLMTMVKTGKLELKRIEINKPDIQVWLNGEKYILLPYKDTLAVKNRYRQKQ